MNVFVRPIASVGAVLTLIAATTTGCSDSTPTAQPAASATTASASPSGSASAPGSASPPAGKKSPMAATGIRETVRKAMEAAGRPDRAALAADSQSTMLDELSVPVLRGWRLLRFDAVPHPGASFYVAVGPAGVFHLTEDPASFAKMFKAANVTLASPGDAAALARAYIETTRPMTELIRVVGGIDDILWMPKPTVSERRAREKSSSKLRPILRPPHAAGKGDSWEATVYVQRGDTVEQRTVTISADGSLTERGKVIARGLPVPYVL